MSETTGGNLEKNLTSICIFSGTRLCSKPCKGQLQEAVELRERHFGCYELMSHDNYHKVWKEDKVSSSNKPEGIASEQNCY